MTTRRFNHRPAFTLVELLVVIGIIALLLALLLPSLAAARQAGQGVTCLARLREMTHFALLYGNAYHQRLPPAYDFAAFPTTLRSWDYHRIDGETVSGYLWLGAEPGRVVTCPTWIDPAGEGDTYTGYNYNTSHLAGFRDLGETAWTDSERLTRVRHTSDTALFGDGQWKGGANRYMRSPLTSDRDRTSLPLNARFAGTQGYRHRGRTNVAHPDGHAATTDKRHLGHTSYADQIPDAVGFLSADNSAYDTD